MHLSFSSNAFSKYSLPEAIGHLAKIGYKGIEIMADIPHAYPPQLTARHIADILEALKRHRMRVSNVNAFTLHAEGDTWNPSWIDPDPARRERRILHTIDCIVLASILGAPSISTEPGGLLGEMDREDALKLFREGLERVEDEARAHGVKVLIEPEPGLLIETSPQFVDFYRTLDPLVFGLNFDIGHFYCVGEEPQQLIRELKDCIEHVHLEDIAANRKHVHLLPGEGAIGLDGVLHAMREEGYGGFVTVELYTCSDRPIDAAAHSYKYLSPAFH